MIDSTKCTYVPSTLHLRAVGLARIWISIFRSTSRSGFAGLSKNACREVNNAQFHHPSDHPTMPSKKKRAALRKQQKEEQRAKQANAIAINERRNVGSNKRSSISDESWRSLPSFQIHFENFWSLKLFDSVGEKLGNGSSNSSLSIRSLATFIL